MQPAKPLYYGPSRVFPRDHGEICSFAFTFLRMQPIFEVVTGRDNPKTIRLFIGLRIRQKSLLDYVGRAVKYNTLAEIHREPGFGFINLPAPTFGASCDSPLRLFNN